MKNISIAILCGGKSTRMGTDKAKLIWQNRTFLEHIANQLKKDDPLFFSVGRQCYNDIIEGHFVVDRYQDCGPLGGLEAVLDACETESIFITTVDLPFVDRTFIEELETYVSPAIDAVIPIEEDGKIHPLCAIYKKNLHSMIEQQLLEQHYKVQAFLKNIRVCYVPVKKLRNGLQKLDNINTPQDYERIMNNQYPYHSEEIPMFSIVAYSGSGKTTFLEKLIVELKKRKVRLAVIKHDAHHFEIDKPGKDSYRFSKAGADTVILMSDEQSVRIDHYKIDISEMIKRINNVDLILTEGYKHRQYKKILFYREAAQKPPAIDFKKEQPVLIVSDRTDWPDATCDVIGLEDIEKAADYLCSFL